MIDIVMVISCVVGVLIAQAITLTFLGIYFWIKDYLSGDPPTWNKTHDSLGGR